MYENLKKLRESLGLTQEEFGKSIGLAKTTYNNYETGNREPKSDFWIAVAKKYNVTIDYLMGYSQSPHLTSAAQKTSPNTAGAASEEEKVTREELVSLLRRMGCINKTEQLSDADFALVDHMLGILEAWFNKAE